MSEIKVDALTGKTTAGDITVTSEGGAATMQLQQGLVKSFEIHDDDETTVLESINISSITDGTTGICSPVFINNMSSVNYFTAGSTGEESTSYGIISSVRHGAAATTSTYTYAVQNSTATLVDRNNTMSACIGDLA